MQLQLTRGVMILGLFLLLVEVAMSAEDAKEVALPELPKGPARSTRTRPRNSPPPIRDSSTAFSARGPGPSRRPPTP